VRRAPASLIPALVSLVAVTATFASPPPAWTTRLFADEIARADPAGSSAGSPSPAESPPEKKRRCSDPGARASEGRCLPQLFAHDAKEVFTAPARWTNREWALFTVGTLGIATLMVSFDDRLRSAVLNDPGGVKDQVASFFEPLGSWGSFVVLGGFYAGGLAAHDDKARGVAIDGLTASVISGIIITPVLKKVFGRSRPDEGQGPHDFSPFHGGGSFPSGHGTQAFTVASVIATTYPKAWVRAACYVPASLVLYARMRHDAHWASDVAAGALIGYSVGITVVRTNLPQRLGARHVGVVPMLGPKGSGAVLTARF